MVKEAEDLHKNHSQKGATSPAYLQTQTEIKGLKLHNAQNSRMDSSLIVHVVYWLHINRILYCQLRQMFWAHKNKKQMDKTGYNGWNPDNVWINDFIISDNKICIPETHISRLYIFSTKSVTLYLYEVHDLIRQLTVNICAIFCCCGIEQWFSMDRMTG